MTTPTPIETALASENRRLRQALKVAEDKALRFDLYQAGVEQAERDAVELVELRAKIDRYQKRMERYRQAIRQLNEALEEEIRRNVATRPNS